MNIVQIGGEDMQKAVVSREAILAAAAEILREQGADGLNMREVAARCGIAVGSVYNYFPSKSDLALAVVEDFWRSVVHPQVCPSGGTFPFDQTVEFLYASLRQGTQDSGQLLLLHPTLIATEDKEAGRVVMERTFRHIRAALLHSLTADSGVKPDVFDDEFTPEQFVAFVFSHLIMELTKGQRECGFLLELIRRVLYQ